MYGAMRSILWGFLLSVSLVPAFVGAEVIETYPWTGLTTQQITAGSGNFLWQPIGLTTAASGTVLSAIRVYGSVTTTNGNGLRWDLFGYDNTTFSGTAVQTCEFRMDPDPVPAGTYTGYLTFNSYLADCVLDGHRWYVMRLVTVFNNATFSLQGNTPQFKTQSAIREGTTWAGGSEDSAVQAIWFQWFDNASSTAVFSFGVFSTSTTGSKDDLIAAIDTYAACKTAESTLGYGLCRVFTFLFSPLPQTITDFSDYWSTVEHKPPFGYFYAASDAMAGFASTTAATSSSSYLFAVAGAATSIYGSFGYTMQDKLSIVLWVMFGIYVLVRIMRFDFHA